jgi:hypothetical protein
MIRAYVTIMHKTRASLVLAIVASLHGCFTPSLTRSKDPGLPTSYVTVTVYLLV